MRLGRRVEPEAADLALTQAPESIAILRLSSAGDLCHVLPLIATLRARWPDVGIDWIVGASGYELVRDVPDVQFHVVKDTRKLSGLRALSRSLGRRRFDVLLHLHPYFKANLASLCVRAKVRLGYDRIRSRDLHRLFTTHAIPPARAQHVQAAFLSFASALGATETCLCWDFGVRPSERERCEALWPISGAPRVVVHPGSAVLAKVWTEEGYAAVCRHARSRGAEVALTGGPAASERAMVQRIAARAGVPCLDLSGQISLKQQFALLQTTDIYVGPDTGPTHLAAASGAAVIGLYGATDPRRTGPWRQLDRVVSCYEETLLERTGKLPDQVRFGTRFHDGRPLEKIAPERVIDRFDEVWRARIG
jgi:heptosyltransferase I